MPQPQSENDCPTEDTPLLRADSAHDTKRPVPVTPLPKLQISILFVLLLVEPIFSQCIYPFINQVRPKLHRFTSQPDS